MNLQPIRYFLYARKSSESEDRQMASIEDQIQVIKQLALDKGIQIVEVFQESKSAKAPGRPVFNAMISRIEQGEAEGIICWKLNRLARNPIDGGRISWLLQNNVIKHIQCNSSSYLPTDNVLMMAVELGMANQFIKDLSSDIQRGLLKKAERGWFPSPVLPIGYKHHKSSKRKVEKEEIIPDPKRFKQIKRLWKLMETGRYNITDIKREGDLIGLENDSKKPYCLSTYFGIFSNSFYYGEFFWKNAHGIKTKFKGKHKKMIDLFTFNKVNAIIKKQAKKTRPKTYDFPFRGWLTCGECSSAITAERKVQVRCTHCHFKFSARQRDNCSKCFTKISNMKNPTIVDKTYYRCVKKKGFCSQKYIEQSILKQQFIDFLYGLSIPESIGRFLVKYIKQDRDQTFKENERHVQRLNQRKQELINRQDGLLNIYADGGIDKVLYEQKNLGIQKEINKLDVEISSTHKMENQIDSVLDSILNISKKAQEIIKSGQTNKIKGLLSQFGSNQYIKDQSLYIISPKHLSAFLKCVNLLKAKKRRLEPQNPLEKQGDLDGLETLSPILCKELQQARMCIENYIMSIYQSR